jgi:hypothetical protein
MALAVCAWMLAPAATVPQGAVVLVVVAWPFGSARTTARTRGLASLSSSARRVSLPRSPTTILEHSGAPRRHQSPKRSVDTQLIRGRAVDALGAPVVDVDIHGETT